MTSDSQSIILFVSIFFFFFLINTLHTSWSSKEMLFLSIIILLFCSSLCFGNAVAIVAEMNKSKRILIYPFFETMTHSSSMKRTSPVNTSKTTPWYQTDILQLQLYYGMAWAMTAAILILWGEWATWLEIV